MPSTPLASCFAALALALLVAPASSDESISSVAQPELLSTPLTLEDAPHPTTFVGPPHPNSNSTAPATPLEQSVHSPAPDSAESVPTGSVLNESTGEAAVADMPESRWAARTLPGSARKQASESSVPISGDGLRDALKVGGGLAVVLVLLLGLRWLVRRNGTGTGRTLAGGRSPSGVANILARYPIARGQQVLLLGVGQRIIVVHQSAGTLQTLSEITDPDEVLALRMQINGTERSQGDQGFSAKITQTLERKPDGPALEPVAGMPGLVSETVDLTRKRGVRLSGGGL